MVSFIKKSNKINSEGAGVQNRVQEITSLKKLIVKNKSRKEAIIHKLNTLATNLPAMTVSPSHVPFKVIGLVSASANARGEQDMEATNQDPDWSGNESSSINRNLGVAESRVLARLKAKASSFGANAIIGLSLDFEVEGRSSLSITAHGTAVIFDKPGEIFLEEQINILKNIENSRSDLRKVLQEIDMLNKELSGLEA